MSTGPALLLPAQNVDLRRFCVGVIVLGLIIAIGALIALHVLPSGLSWIRNPVGQYEITKYRIGYRVQTLSFGIAGLAAAIGLGAQRYSSLSMVVPTLIFAIGRLLISWFPMDKPGDAVSKTGRRHALLAIISVLSALFAAQRISSFILVFTGPRYIQELSNYVPVIMLFGLVGMVMNLRRKVGAFGLAERAFYLGTIAWLIVSASAIAQFL